MARLDLDAPRDKARRLFSGREKSPTAAPAPNIFPVVLGEFEADDACAHDGRDDPAANEGADGSPHDGCSCGGHGRHHGSGHRHHHGNSHEPERNDERTPADSD